MAKEFKGEIKLDVRESTPDWEAFLADKAPGGRAERARRPLRRHRPGGVVALRRAHQHADDGPVGGQRPDLHPVAHDRALLADALDVPDRAQPPPERLRVDLRDRRPASPGTARTSRQRTRTMATRPARRRLEHVLGRQEPQRAGRRVDDGLVEEELAAGHGLRPLLRLHRRRDQQLVSRPGRRQPLHRPAVPARRRLPPVQGPRRQGARVHPRLEAVRARQALVPVVLPRRQPRAAPRARRSTSTSTRASSTTATRPTASGCCRG